MRKWVEDQGWGKFVWVLVSEIQRVLKTEGRVWLSTPESWGTQTTEFLNSNWIPEFKHSLRLSLPARHWTLLCFSPQSCGLLWILLVTLFVWCLGCLENKYKQYQCDQIPINSDIKGNSEVFCALVTNVMNDKGRRIQSLSEKFRLHTPHVNVWMGRYILYKSLHPPQLRN